MAGNAVAEGEGTTEGSAVEVAARGEGRAEGSGETPREVLHALEINNERKNKKETTVFIGGKGL